MQTVEAKKNLQISAGEDGHTAVYRKECLRRAYFKDGYFPEINHKKDCLTGQTLAAAPSADLQTASL